MQPKNITEIILRLTAEFIRQSRLLLVAGLLPLVLMASGCATTPPTHGKKWVCTGKCSIPARQAHAKCVAQANAVLRADYYYKLGLMRNCMTGEGWEEEECLLAGDPDCK